MLEAGDGIFNGAPKIRLLEETLTDPRTQQRQVRKGATYEPGDDPEPKVRNFRS